MDSFIYSINATVPVFLIMVLGWFLHRCGMLDDNFADKANKYVFHVALPVMLFQNVAGADARSNFNLTFVLFCSLVTSVCFLVIWLLTELFMKEEEQKGSFIQGSFRGSAAILGLAFIQNMYPTAGLAPLMIVSAVPLYNIFSVIILTFKARKPEGEAEAAPGGQIRKAFVNILKNPIIIGIVLGIPFSILQVPFPAIINRSISLVAQTATPLALLVIGAGFKGREAIKKWKPTVTASAVKLVIQAAVFLPLAVWLGFRNQDLIAILIMLGSPSTVSCYIMARNMHNDEVLSSSIIVLTTMLSAVTLTGWIFLLRQMGLV